MLPCPPPPNSLVYYVHPRMLTLSVNTHTNTLPDKRKMNLVQTRAIGLSPLKGDFLADPLQASLLKHDRKFTGKTFSLKELKHCRPCENRTAAALMDMEMPFGERAPQGNPF